MEISDTLKPQKVSLQRAGSAPRYVPDSPWSESVTASMTEIEDVMGGGRKQTRNVRDTKPTFAIVRDPSNSEMYVFTRMPKNEGKRGSRTSGLVRVCPIEKDQINPDYLAENVNPMVKAIRGNNPPYISDAELMAHKADVKRTVQVAAAPIALTGAGLLVAYGSYVFGGHGEHGSIAVKTAETLVLGKTIGSGSLSLAALASTSSLLKCYLSKPTRSKATFAEDGEGVQCLDGPSSYRVTGKPTLGELQHLRASLQNDPSASMPGFA